MRAVLFLLGCAWIPESEHLARLAAGGAGATADAPTCDEGVHDLLVPDDHPTIREAVEASAEGDSICVRAGTYAETVDLLTTSLSITGEGAGQTILNGAGEGPVILVSGRGNAPVSVAWLSIVGGIGSSGGGVRVTGAELVLDHVAIEGNEATEGAGAYVSGGSLEVRSSVVTDNTASGSGGGLFALDADLVLTDTSLIGNEAGAGGGGVELSYSTLTTTGVAFIGNATLDGTAVNGGGGGIHATAATVSLASTTLAANATYGRGGGMYFEGEVTAVLENVSLVGNRALNGGAIFATYDSTSADLDSTIVAYNLATASVGGLWAYSDAKFSIRTSLFWGNTEPDISEIDDPIGSNGNLADDPAFLTRGPYLDALSWDLHLAPGSPAIDAGSEAWNDADGSPTDMGAFGGPDADATYYLDADGDTLWDGWESAYGVDDPSADEDSDRLTTLEEFGTGTNPVVQDTDGDGAPDGTEVSAGTDPLDPGDK